jgi:PHD/YefM family antitoxin component YafN of YafNO toxin-antitoxin module
MLSTEHTQSLTDFRQKATETLDRLNRTGEAEILTVNGQARAVLLAPKVYDELAREAQLTRDAAAIGKAMKQIDEGAGMTSEQVFGPIRKRLRGMKRAGRTKSPRK